MAERGVGFLDAPVSGGSNGAESGSLTIMIGGSCRDLARARPVLECFGERIEHRGPVGAGHALKALDNGLLAVHIRAFAEGFAALVRSGVRAGGAVEVLNVSSGRSLVSEYLVPERVLTGAWPRTCRLALLERDLRIATAQLFAAARAELGDEPITWR